MQKVVDVVKASEMRPDWKEGHWHGGNRCVPACTAMAAFTEKLGPAQDPSKTVEDAVLQFTRDWGGIGTTPEIIGVLPNENFTHWVNNNGGTAKELFHYHGSASAHSQDFETIVAMVDRGNYGMIAVRDCKKARKSDGSPPYTEIRLGDNVGHVMIVCGYDTVTRSVRVNDPLIGTNHQPDWYSYASLVTAQLYYLVEVIAMGTPQGWTLVHDKVHNTDELHNPTNSFKVVTGFKNFILAARGWDGADVPLEEEQTDGIGTYQTFVYTRLRWHRATDKIERSPLGQVILALKNADPEILAKVEPPL